MSLLLRVEGLGLRFELDRGRVLRALHQVSLTLDRGQILAVVGESGSGKSTLAKVLLRLLQPAEGRFLLKGQDVVATEPRSGSLGYRKQVQMIFQDPFGSFNPVHRIGRHLQRPLRLHGQGGADLSAAAVTLLEAAGLLPGADFINKFPHELSGGQRQRAAIARALAPEPELIVADEPTSMLDVSVRMDVLRLLAQLREQRGLALLLITHDLSAARYLADRILVLYAGQVMEEAPADALVRSPRHPYTRLLVAAAVRGDGLMQPLPGRPGLPPNVDPPPGCPFAARCPDVQPRCHSELPAIHLLPDARRVRCHLVESEAQSHA